MFRGARSFLCLHARSSGHDPRVLGSGFSPRPASSARASVGVVRAFPARMDPESRAGFGGITVFAQWCRMQNCSNNVHVLVQVVPRRAANARTTWKSGSRLLGCVSQCCAGTSDTGMGWGSAHRPRSASDRIAPRWAGLGVGAFELAFRTAHEDRDTPASEERGQRTKFILPSALSKKLTQESIGVTFSHYLKNYR